MIKNPVTDHLPTGCKKIGRSLLLLFSLSNITVFSTKLRSLPCFSYHNGSISFIVKDHRELFLLLSQWDMFFSTNKEISFRNSCDYKINVHVIKSK